jgi:hypothetical protein
MRYVRAALFAAVTAVTAVTSSFISSADAQARPGDAEPPAPGSIVMETTIDVPLIDPGIPGAALPVISLMVNGKGPYRFGVETGAGFIAVSRELVEAVGLKRSGGDDELPEYAVDSITFGGASFRDVRVAAIPRNARGVDGLLGLPFFRNVSFTVDYPANRLRISRDTLPATNGKDILPLSRVGPFLGLPIRLGGEAFTAVLDTRSMAGMSITTKGAQGLQFQDSLRVVGRSGGAGIPPADVREGRLKGEATIGAYAFPAPPLSVRELPPGFPEGPLVGSRVLRNFAITVDQRRMRLRLAREGSTTIDLGGVRSASAAGPNAAPSAVSDYVGSYGDRTISLVNGKLHIQRPNGRLLEMTSTGTDTFTLVDVPTARIEFVRGGGGRVEEIRVMNPQGQWETARRSSGAP